MEFLIKRKPGLSGALFKRQDKTVGEAINSVYGNDFRNWEIIFSNIPINLCMFCIPDVYADMVEIVEKIELGKKFEISLLSPEIACFLAIEPRERDIAINSVWTSASTNEYLKDLQGLPQPNLFDKEEFVSQLTAFLQSVKDDLISVGYGYLFNNRHPWGIRLY